MEKYARLTTLTNKAVHYMLKPVRNTRMLFIFALLMCNLIAAVSNWLGIWSNPFLAFLLSVFDCYVLSALAGLLKKVRLGFLMGALMTAVLFGELFTLLFYKSNFTVYVVLLLLETNAKESSQFVGAVLGQQSTWIATLLTVMTAVLAWWLARLSRRRFRYKGAVMFVAFGIIVWSGTRQLSAYYKLGRCFGSASTTVCNDPHYRPHLDTPFVRLAYGVAYNVASSAELDVLAVTVEQTQVDSCAYRSPLIVLVIGESYNKHHSQLYGYQLPTTPRLQQLADESRLVVYSDAVTTYNFTSNAFKYMFSTWDQDDADDWTRHTLFPAVFRKAGYEVHFITNQFTMEQTNVWDFTGGTIFNHGRLSQLQFSSRNEHVYPYDHLMLSCIPTVDSLTAHPTLLIVHLEGQHVRYDRKYPQEYARFTAADELTPHGGEQGRQMAAYYDNATYYNDFVVDSIFRMVKGTDAIGIYLADHGEEAYDWRNQYERTNEAALYPEVAHYQYEIPFMFYLTDSFAVRHADVAGQIRMCKDRPFINGDLSHLLFYLAGISSNEYKEQRNILSPRYDAKRPRIIRGDAVYEEVIKGYKQP